MKNHIFVLLSLASIFLVIGGLLSVFIIGPPGFLIAGAGVLIMIAMSEYLDHVFGYSKE